MQVVSDFKVNFDNFGLNISLKVHVIVHHFEDYFDWISKTMKYTNGEFMESLHSTLRVSEENHNFKVKRNLGSQIHLQKSLQSISWHNSKRIEYISSKQLKIKEKTCTGGIPKEFNFSKSF